MRLSNWVCVLRPSYRCLSFTTYTIFTVAAMPGGPASLNGSKYESATTSAISKGCWTIGLVNSRFKYLSAETFGFRTNANGKSLKKKQTWILEPSTDGQSVTLKSHLDKYLSVDQFGNITCDQVGFKRPFKAFYRGLIDVYFVGGQRRDVQVRDHGLWGLFRTVGVQERRPGLLFGCQRRLAPMQGQKPGGFRTVARPLGCQAPSQPTIDRTQAFRSLVRGPGRNPRGGERPVGRGHLVHPGVQGGVEQVRHFDLHKSVFAKRWQAYDQH